MFDIGMSELMLIGIVALIVVGPKDLPRLFHTLGRFTARMRALGREFTSAMNEAARESGVDDIAKGLKGAANPSKFGLDKLKGAADRFEKWEPGKPGATPKAPVDPERAADIEKIRAASEKAGQARLDREAAAKVAPQSASAAKPGAESAASKTAQKAAPKTAPKTAQKAAPKTAPKTAQKATPKSAPKSAPKTAPKAAAKKPPAKAGAASTAAAKAARPKPKAPEADSK